MKFKPSVLIIFADNSKNQQQEMSLNRTVTDYFEKELRLNEIFVETIDLFKDYKSGEFDPILDINFSNKKIQEYQIKIKKFDHIVFIYSPIWSGLPALLKGFLDTVFVSGFAFEPNSKFLNRGGYLNEKTCQVLVLEEKNLMHSVICNNNADKNFWQRNIFAQTGMRGEVKYFYDTARMSVEKMDNINREVKNSIFKISPLIKI